MIITKRWKYSYDYKEAFADKSNFVIGLPIKSWNEVKQNI